MFKGLLFFFRTGWKYDRRYIIWNILSQLLSSLTPILAALAPKLIIDELMGARRPERIILCIAVFAGWTLLSGSLSSFFLHDGFIRRCRVSSRFDLNQHQRLALADLERLESPAFRDMKEKANKFLTCDWHGFGYLLDCALKIIGQSITLIGLTAIIASLSLWIVLAFALLAAGSVWFESRMRKKALILAQTVISNQRKWMYYSSAFEETKFAKEIRLNRLSDWLLRKEQAASRRIIRTLIFMLLQWMRSLMIMAILSLVLAMRVTASSRFKDRYLITWCRRGGRPHRPGRAGCSRGHSGVHRRQPRRYPHRDALPAPA